MYLGAEEGPGLAGHEQRDVVLLGRSLEPVDAKGHHVDAKGHHVDAKGYHVDAKGHHVDAKGHH
eukprot:118212-Rhodomonas_salina.2